MPGCSLPKGHVEPIDATTEAAARREILEETGLRHLTLVGELGSFVRVSSDGLETKRITLFLYSTDERLLNPIAKHHAEWRSRQAAWMLIKQVRPADAEQLIKHKQRIDALSKQQLARHSGPAGPTELAV